MPSNIIKCILVVLLLLCLLKLTYGLYMLLRVIFTAGFVVLAVRADVDKKSTEVFVYVVLALLFQPLLKIPLGRIIWNIVDVVVAVGLLMDISRLLIKADKNG